VRAMQLALSVPLDLSEKLTVPYEFKDGRVRVACLNLFVKFHIQSLEIKLEGNEYWKKHCGQWLSYFLDTELLSSPSNVSSSACQGRPSIHAIIILISFLYGYTV
jgi:hypothetical protein